MIMNLDTWNGLPPDIQKAITSVSGVKGAEFLGREGLDKSEEPSRKMIQETKNEFYSVSKDELAKWTEIGGKPLWDQWAKDMGAKGLAGQKMLDAALVKIKKYNK